MAELKDLSNASRSQENIFMKYPIILIFLFTGAAFSQISGLAGWDIYIDPGHSQTENMGVYGYSEAERNLRVGLRLREMLLNETDIDTVYICRTNDAQQVSLSQRTNQANALGVQWYHSIHSDAGESFYNSTLLLHGGWRENGETVEKTPMGGKEMSDYMVDFLTRGMRIDTRGNYADRTFYQGFPQNHDYKFPYLHVNRETTMASELSESGFHTNPRQNQLFMNEDWKRLEARTFFWSILKYHKIARPLIRILTGIVSDIETEIPINAATIQVGDRTYTTDSYESLFYKYSSDPELLHNGFYYFENVEGDYADVMAQAEGFYSDTVQIAMIDTFFTFKDFRLISKALPRVVSTIPANGDTGYSVLEDIIIQFNRPMNPDSVEANLNAFPEIHGRFAWSDLNRHLKISPEQLNFKTDYTIRIAGQVRDNYGHPLDGDGDGTGGDDFILSFKTGFDNIPPAQLAVYPPGSSSKIELRPIINVEYDEELDPESITEDVFKLERFSDGSAVPGMLEHYVVKKRSVLNFFPELKLHPSEIYITRIYAGLKDLLGNSTTKLSSNSFQTGNEDIVITLIDNFESGLTSNWWAPDQSGTKAGYEPATTRRENMEYVNGLTQSTISMEIYYDWDVSAAEWILREYLAGGSPRSVFFNQDYVLQIYIFGDGSGNQFRFALDEGTSSTNLPNHEVSQWYTIDWIGWRLLEWDLSDPNSVGQWIGNGILDGTTYRFDSIQLTHLPGAAETGSLYFDDLRIVQKVPATNLELEQTTPPLRYFLDQNYPNPFNPETEIRFGLAQNGPIRIDIYNILGQHIQTVFNGWLPAGIHSLKFNGTELASGSYTYRIKAGQFEAIKRMLIVK